jgi:hypothetical protein
VTHRQWILLDNVRSGWPHGTNLHPEDADGLLQWAVRDGLVSAGRLTPAGEVAMLVADAAPCTQEAEA